MTTQEFYVRILPLLIFLSSLHSSFSTIRMNCLAKIQVSRQFASWP